MSSFRCLVSAAALLAGLSTGALAFEDQAFLVDGEAALWHSPNMASAETALVEPGRARLGDLAYDNHFLNTGGPPNWDFLVPLEAPDTGVARLASGTVTFPASQRRVAVRTGALPDTATPAAPFLLAAPAADAVLAVEPYYLFRNKQTAYRLAVFTSKGIAGPSFESLPTHAVAGTPGVLVAPERAGCCEEMTWSIRFYDIAAGTLQSYECPPGRCGDLILTRPDPNGPVLIAMEVFETLPGLGSVVETRLFVVAPDGTPLAAGRLAHAARDAAVGAVPDWAACASRVLAAEGSPYALAHLTAMRRLDAGRWAFRFDAPGASRTWIVDGVSHHEAPRVLFAS